jgi:hypothetical protein
VKEQVTVIAPPPPGVPSSAHADEKTRVLPSVVVRTPTDPILLSGPPREPTAPSVRAPGRPELEMKRRVADEETRVAPLELPGGTIAPPPAAAKSKATRITPLRIGILAMMVTVFALVTVAANQKKTSAAPAVKRTATTSQARPGSSGASATLHAQATGSAVDGAAVSAPGTRAQPVTPMGANATAPLPSDSQTSPVARAPAAGSAPSVTAEPGSERAAVLAVESGATDRAANLYASLAASHPERSAYGEAARILRARAASH